MRGSERASERASLLRMNGQNPCPCLGRSVYSVKSKDRGVGGTLQVAGVGIGSACPVQSCYRGGNDEVQKRNESQYRREADQVVIQRG
ncbi:putative pinoresinol-lariciresinol reductase 3 [Fusarium oxysporum f. sp. albedinis]|nr:putative pinoresinol-lariciresinol reductase 3 [Fusarium oxysporum f. sp. albedinis]